MNSSPNADERPPENSFILDASALLVSILGEPGADVIQDAMQAGAYASTVNVAEVLSRLLDIGFSEQDAVDALSSLEYLPVDFTAEHARRSTALRQATRQYGLGLGDRSCLALAVSLGLPVITADRIWRQLDVGAEVVVCR